LPLSLHQEAKGVYKIIKGISKMIDQKTVNRDYPLPNADNKLKEDVVRLNDAFVDIDTDINDLYATTGTLSSGATTATQNTQNGALWHADSTGSGAAYEVVLSPAPTVLNSGLLVHMKAHVLNTGPATLNVNSLGIKAIKKTDGSDLKSGDILSGAACFLFYDGTNFQLINPKVDQVQTEVNTSNIMRAFEEIQENHGGSLLMEAGWSDSFGNANEQGVDEANSIGFQHDITNKLYKGTDPGVGLNADHDYINEGDYTTHEETGIDVTIANDTVTINNSDVFGANVLSARFSPETPFNPANSAKIIARTDSTHVELVSGHGLTASNSSWTIRFFEISAGKTQLSSRETLISAEHVNDGNTLLLVHCNGSDASTSFTDSSSTAHSITATGNAQVDTAIKKFGAGSLLLDGTGDYLSIPDHADWDATKTNFTVDFWAYCTDLSHENGAWMHGTNTNNYHMCTIDTNGSVRWANKGGDSSGTHWDFTSPSTGLVITENSWHHVALVKSGANLYTFIDGILRDTATVSGTPSKFSVALHIGEKAPSTALFEGQIDEFRWSDIARWTTNFNTSNPVSEYIPVIPIAGQLTSAAAWSAENTTSHTQTETLNSASVFYFEIFETNGYGAGTIFKITDGSTNVRSIVQYVGTNWQYNSNVNFGLTTWNNATANNMYQAVRDAMGVSANQYTAASRDSATSTLLDTGFNRGIGVVLYSTNQSNNPSVDQTRINYDSQRDVMDLRSKTYDPNFAPSDAYVWAQVEHSDIDGSGDFYVSRNGGTEWAAVPMAQQGLPLASDIRIYRGTVDVSGQASGQDLRCRYQTTQGKDQFLHSWGLQAKS
jgi:hypothetical protein